MEITDTNIRRFKLIEMNDKEYYLIDVDTYKLSWLFPTLTWYLKNKATRLTREEYKVLRIEKKGLGQKKTLRITTFILGGTLAEGLNVLWGEQMNNKPMSTLIFWLIVLIAVLVIVRTMHSNKDYESLINAMQGRLLTFDNVVYVDRNENNDFKNACIKGIILCFSWYTGLLFVYFYIKTLFWLLLLFVIPYLFTLANGALKPESSSTKIVYRNIVE